MRYVLRRLGFFVVTLWAAMTINFFLPRLMPGNPALAMMARFHGRLNGQALVGDGGGLRRQYQTKPHSQYFSYLGNSFTGHFGTSLTFFPTPVSQVVFTALPWTIGLVGVTTVIAFMLGTLIGMIGGMATRRGSSTASCHRSSSSFRRFPYFWIGMVSILVFADHARLAPDRLRHYSYGTAGNPFVVTSSGTCWSTRSSRGLRSSSPRSAAGS